MGSIEKNEPQSLDSNWYNRFESVAAFQGYEYLAGKAEDKPIWDKEKEEFLSGAKENPSLPYTKLDDVDWQQKRQELLQLKEDIITHEPNEVVKQAYRWRINEKIAEAGMLQAAKDGNMRKFQRYSEFMYGKPSPDISAYTFAGVRQEVEGYKRTGNPVLERAAIELENVLPTPLAGGEIYQLPSVETITQAHEATMAEFKDVIALPINEKKEDITAPEISQAFQGALEKVKAEGWSVVIDYSTRTAVHVSQEKKKVEIPEKRTLAMEKLQQLIVHEIGTHVKRRIIGERSKLKLLGLGLDRYKDDEGVTTMREQALVSAVKDFAGFEGYIASALAAGVDGTPRNFREVFTVLEKYQRCKALAEGKDEQTATKIAQTNAWNRTVRTFRGTDCKTKGKYFGKDMLYREGNIGVWEVMKTNPAEMKRFSIGKYDPANPRHIWVLEQLGITEADLRELEKSEA